MHEPVTMPTSYITRLPESPTYSPISMMRSSDIAASAGSVGRLAYPKDQIVYTKFDRQMPSVFKTAAQRGDTPAKPSILKNVQLGTANPSASQKRVSFSDTKIVRLFTKDPEVAREPTNIRTTRSAREPTADFSQLSQVVPSANAQLVQRAETTVRSNSHGDLAPNRGEHFGELSLSGLKQLLHGRN